MCIRDSPDSDHLHILQVNTGDEKLQIVCGAPNVCAGARVPVAKIGAVLPGDFKIKRSKIRGVESFGMCCSGPVSYTHLDVYQRQMKEEIGAEKIPVVATGGMSNIIAEESKTIDTIDPELTLQGLRILYERNQS